MASSVINDKTFAPESIQKQRAEAGSESVMTLGGTVLRTFVLLALLLATATVGWNQLGSLIGTNWVPYLLFWLALLGISIAAAAMPKYSMIFGPAYALLAGLWIGAISKAYASLYDGVVSQAVLATLAVFFVVLALYTTRIVKVTNRFVGIVVYATLGLLVFYLVTFVMSLFGLNLWAFTWFGLIASAIGAGLASANLLIDFRFIEEGVNGKAPGYMAWYSAFALVATLIWLYLELLRLLSYLRR